MSATRTSSLSFVLALSFSLGAILVGGSPARGYCYECVNDACSAALVGHAGGDVCSSGTYCSDHGCVSSCAISGSCQGSCDPAHPLTCKIKYQTGSTDNTENGFPAAFFSEPLLADPAVARLAAEPAACPSAV